MKRVFSAIIIAIMTLNIFVSISASADTIDVNLPTHDCELGFIFETDGIQYDNTNPADYDGIDTIFDELNIYYASSLDNLKDISEMFNIVSWEENYEIEVPETPEIDIKDVINDTVSLFSVDDENEKIEPISNEPYVNDPWFEWQWYYEAVHAQAYRNNGIDGTGVKIGIIDSGFNNNLEDFNYDNISVVNVHAMVDNNEDRMSFYDDESANGGHGVPVTSIIAAQIDNNIGIAGITDNVEVVIYKIRDYECSYYTQVDAFLRAYSLAYEANVDVINISQGSYTSIDTEEKIINYLIKKGVLIVAAGGNDGNEAAAGDKYNAYGYPAAYTNVIAVGGLTSTSEKNKVYYNRETRYIDEKDNIPSEIRGVATTHTISSIKNNNSGKEYEKAIWSTANDSIFISAPGEVIMIGNDNNFCSKIGTSFSSPIVAAAAIGVKQMRPYVDTDMFKEILKATSVDLDEEGYDINTGWGMVDFQAIYDYVSQMPETLPEQTPEITIDYTNNQLVGFDEGEYSINDTPVTVENGTINIADDWYGTEISIVKKASNSGYSDSEAQLISIPAIPEAPQDVIGGYNSITGMDNTMEYKTSDLNTWISCTEETVLNISAGTYDVRYKATSTSFASSATEVIVFEKEKETTPNIEIDYEKSILKGFSDENVYQINDTEITLLNGEYAIPEAWFGTTISIVVKASSDNKVDSEPQQIDIPAIPEAPNFRYEIIFDNEGAVTSVDGITEEMEFRKVGLNEWTTGEITDAGQYEIRYKATDSSFASFSYIVTFEDKEPEPEYDIETSVSYDNNNISYSYTNNTDKNITASGIIAVYDNQNRFIGMRTINIFYTGTHSNVFPVTGDIGSIKFFVWKGLTDLQPYESTEVSVWERVGE